VRGVQRQKGSELRRTGGGGIRTFVAKWADTTAAIKQTFSGEAPVGGRAENKKTLAIQENQRRG